MASSLMVPVAEIKNVREHPNASMLGLADVLGFQMVMNFIEDENGSIVRRYKKDELDENGRRVPAEESDTDVDVVKYSFRYENGDKVVYFQADTVLPEEWIEKFNVKNFMKGKEKNRVGRIKLRGEPSFGLLAEVQDESWQIGDNVAEYFGAEKYIPPIKPTAGDAAKYDDEIDPYFDRYTDIENIRIYTDIFEDGERIVMTEKIHGTSSKIGVIKGTEVAGSMGRSTDFNGRRKRPKRKVSTVGGGEEETFDPCDFDAPEMKSNTYWFPWTTSGVQSLMKELSAENEVVILYGEVFGGSVQSLNYGIQSGKGFGYRTFDIKVNGKYLDYQPYVELCEKHGVEMVPLLYLGEFSMDKVKELADGETILAATHIREGGVVRPMVERSHPKIGRVCLKVIGTQYELSKHKGKETTDE